MFKLTQFSPCVRASQKAIHLPLKTLSDDTIEIGILKTLAIKMLE